MKNFFTIGQTAKMHDISTQTLVLYHKKGIFAPSYINPENGYRYYSLSDMVILDNILMLKDLELSLKEIKNHIYNKNLENSKKLFENQYKKINKKILHLEDSKRKIKMKIEFLNNQPKNEHYNIEIKEIDEINTINFYIEGSNTINDVDIANKKMLNYMFKNKIFCSYNLGVTIKYEDIIKGNFLKQESVICILNSKIKDNNYKKINRGIYCISYHKGKYEKIGETYTEMLDYIKNKNYIVSGDSIELCIIDAFFEKNDKDYLTKIMIPISAYKKL